jgi:hypothetical protein
MRIPSEILNYAKDAGWLEFCNISALRWVMGVQGAFDGVNQKKRDHLLGSDIHFYTIFNG